jgi:hypothetical protein
VSEVAKANRKVTVKGQVRREDLSGGIWVFCADDGARYQMAGGDQGLLKDGQRATVTGEVDGAAFGIGMVGEILRVQSYTLG